MTVSAAELPIDATLDEPTVMFTDGLSFSAFTDTAATDTMPDRNHRLVPSISAIPIDPPAVVPLMATGAMAAAAPATAGRSVNIRFVLGFYAVTALFFLTMYVEAWF